MGFDWTTAAQGGNAEKMGNGYHHVKIDRVLFASKSKGLFKSKSGDPQIMVVFVGDDGSEASQMFTLSEKAAWTLARLLSCAGANLDAMKAEGVEPLHFTNENLAKVHLVGKHTWIKVEPDPKNAQYQRVTPLHEEDVPQEEKATDAFDPFA